MVSDRRDDFEDAEGTEPAVAKFGGGLCCEGELFSREQDRISYFEGEVATVLICVSSLEGFSCGGLLLYEQVKVAQAGGVIIGSCWGW